MKPHPFLWIVPINIAGWAAIIGFPAATLFTVAGCLAYVTIRDAVARFSGEF